MASFEMALKIILTTENTIKRLSLDINSPNAGTQCPTIAPVATKKFTQMVFDNNGDLDSITLSPLYKLAYCN